MEVFKAYAKDRVLLLHPLTHLVMRMRLLLVFSHFSPNLKKCAVGSALGELSADFRTSTSGSCGPGPFLWRDEAGFQWVQMASGRWCRVDNPAVHWDAPGWWGCCCGLQFLGSFCPSLCNDRCRSRVQAELGSLFMRQSTVAFERISCISCSRCSHLDIWRILSSWLRIWQIHVLCLGVACGLRKNEFFERFCGYSCATLGSTVDTCSASARDASGRNAHILHGQVGSNPEVFSSSSRRMESVLSRCLRCLEIGNSMHEMRVAVSVHDDG